MKSSCNVVVLGATGLVGQAVVEVLEQQKFPVKTLYLLASSQSAGTSMIFKGEDIEVLEASSFDFSRARVAFFSAGATVSAEYAPKAAQANCLVIDNTSAFRTDKEIPLVVPEVNAHRIADYRNKWIIANPNCSTIQLLLALKPIYDAVGIERVHVASYQAVSGTGRKGTDALMSESVDVLNANNISEGVFPKRIAFNVIPQAGDFNEDGHTEEEVKLRRETHKIMEDADIDVIATCARVPVFNGHSEAVHIETKKPLPAKTARDILSTAPGVCVVDERVTGGYQTAGELGASSDCVYVGRIRNEPLRPNGLCMWVVGDNIRKGAALNSVQIAMRWWDEHAQQR